MAAVDGARERLEAGRRGGELKADDGRRAGGGLGVRDRLQRRRGELVAGGQQRVDEAALLAEAQHVRRARAKFRSRGGRLAVAAAEPDVGVGGADRGVERDAPSAARSGRRATIPARRTGRARGAARRRRTAGRRGRARRGRRARCWRSPPSGPRGPAAWPRRAGRGAGRRARTRAGRGRGRAARSGTRPRPASDRVPSSTSPASSSGSGMPSTPRPAGRVRSASAVRPRGRRALVRGRAARRRARGAGPSVGCGLGSATAGAVRPGGSIVASRRSAEKALTPSAAAASAMSSSTRAPLMGRGTSPSAQPR